MLRKIADTIAVVSLAQKLTWSSTLEGMRHSMDAQTAQEECKLFLAALESYRTGKMTPLLKEELKYQIQSRRLSEGRNELTLDLQADMSRHDELQHQLRPDEIERIETRKEQNRLAAQKLGMKRKLEKDLVLKEYVELKKKNSVLREEIKRLSSEKEMMTMIMKHMSGINCTCHRTINWLDFNKKVISCHFKH